MHSVLEEQIKNTFLNPEEIPAEFKKFFTLVNDTYFKLESKADQQTKESPKVQETSSDNSPAIIRSIAHDFNNILGIIFGYITYMQMEGIDPKKASENVDAVTSAIKRGSNLVKQLQSIARQSKKNVELINLDEVLGDLESEYKTKISKSIELFIERDEKLPQFFADKVQLSQLLINLCSNSVDAMPGGGHIIIAISSVSGSNLRSRFSDSMADAYIHLKLTDIGTGMDDSTLSRISEPFFTTKKREKKMGLGLTISYGIIKNHEGFINVESKVGVGTTIHVYLPAVAEYDESDLSTAQPTTIIKGTETVLVVEDESFLSSFVQSLLEGQGYHVLTAEDGEEAVEKYRSNQSEIALVLTDLGLPKLDGMQLAETIREVNKTVPIIFASGSLEKESVQKLNNFQPGKVIQKPYDMKEVFVIIRKMIDHSHNQ